MIDDGTRTTPVQAGDDRFARVLDIVSKRLEAQEFRTWFRSVHMQSWAEGRLVVEVPNRFYQEWFQTKFRELVRQSAEAVSHAPVDVRFEVGAAPASPSGTQQASLPQGGPAGVGHAGAAQGSAQASPSSAHASNGHAPLGGRLAEPRPFREPSEPAYDPILAPVPLNPHYTFQQFVTGPSNEMAYASARGVADDPGTNYNPLFIHGSVGLGKTHLLHAICNEFRRRFPDRRLCLLSCEEFTNAFIHALGRNQVEAFRERLRRVHLLVIDDIHFLANKERTQEEFFNTFNVLHQMRCQIVLSSDAAPSDIPSLKERLVSRFTWGLVTCLEQPETETRMAIVRRKAEIMGVDIPNDVVEFISTHFRNNIRELEGALQSVKARAEIEHSPIDMPLAERALSALIRLPEKRLDIDTIVQVVCSHYGVTSGDLQSRKRTRNISGPRQVAMYLTRALTNLSLQEIGSWFGGRDHTTVLFSVQKTEERVASDERLLQLLERFKDRLGAY